MSFALHREEAENVGDPDDVSFQELAGVAPPCDECGEREADREVRGRPLCQPCIDDLDLDGSGVTGR
jgi:hypothetical protein